MNPSRILRLSHQEIAIIVAAVAVVIFTIPNVSIAQNRSAVISIADAKKLPRGSAINIAGTVTLASGTFRSSFSDEGFQIQDKTGGMYVSIKTNIHLAVGQKVRLTGTLTETPLKFQIVETDESRVQVIPGASRANPIKLQTGAIAKTNIGKLIKITGKVSKPVDAVLPYGFRVSIDDGTGEIIAYVSTSTNISQTQFVTGQTVELIGIAGKFNEHYQIYPRSSADVKLTEKSARQNKFGKLPVTKFAD